MSPMAEDRAKRKATRYNPPCSPEGRLCNQLRQRPVCEREKAH